MFDRPTPPVTFGHVVNLNPTYKRGGRWKMSRCRFHESLVSKWWSGSGINLDATIHLVSVTGSWYAVQSLKSSQVKLWNPHQRLQRIVDHDFQVSARQWTLIRRTEIYTSIDRYYHAQNGTIELHTKDSWPGFSLVLHARVSCSERYRSNGPCILSLATRRVKRQKRIVIGLGRKIMKMGLTSVSVKGHTSLDC